MEPHHIHVPHVPEKDIRIVFVISLILKAANAALQTFLGLVLLFTGSISEYFVSLINNELVEDPSNFFANHLSGIATHISAGGQLYASAYLLSHGIIKALLVWGLIKNKLWAYPASLSVFALFIVYQMVSIVSTHSIFMILLTIFDLLVIWLIWHEYKYLSKRKKLDFKA